MVNLDVRYKATTNHFWQFEDMHEGIEIVDRGSTNNPLTDVIRRRAKEYDDDLVGYGLTHDTFGTGSQTMYVDLANKNGAALGTQFLQGLGSGATRSIPLNRGDVNAGCVNLANDLNKEHVYLKDCLLYASACEYGITWAVWLQFLSINMETKEILIGTGPISARGF
ncbi:hypothetical protein EG68_10025 [Paragonimus skrjabini miyazakii]|uniref:Uncharacterized protein n=1 Tax=Paragonimus skrjabini miyazakii TaxID=59628 RepID=A0A8S9YE43_9TREM|nr:hypothetical protein EG68_10025 [Paragonimus skrjabini miyazakii]